MSIPHPNEQQQNQFPAALVSKSFLAWWMSHACIFPKEGTARGVPIDGKMLEPNKMQIALQEAISWFRKKELPAEIILLKPRTKGASTIVSAVAFHFLSGAPKGSMGMLMTGNEDQSQPMMEMLKRYAENDRFFTTNKCDVKPAGFAAKWQNGNQLVAKTLGGKSAGIGGMVRFFWATEEALYDSPADDNIAGAKERLANAMIAVSKAPGSISIEESTARGQMGVFYERFMAAEPWEQVKRNDGFSGDVKRISLFFPFFDFPTSLEIGPDLSPEEDAAFIADLSPDEAEYRAKVHRETNFLLTGTHMKWRRWAISNLCNDDHTKFDRDYPYSAKEAFSKSGNPRFSKKGLSILRSRLRLAPSPEMGNLTLQGKDPWSRKEPITWSRVHTAQEAKLWIYEQPVPGCRYIVVCDPCVGKVNPGAKDPDNHGIGVFRMGFNDHNGWHPFKLVAQCAVPDGQKLICRWEPGYAEQELWKLSRYYGGTNMVPIVIELPMDSGLNRSLKERGAPLYVQTKPNTIEETDATTYGFLQTKDTKADIIGRLAQRIVENFKAEDGGCLPGGGIDVPDEWTIRELENFVQKPNGSCEAGSGHDDQVLKLGIGLACEGAGIPYVPSMRSLARWERDDIREGQKGSTRKKW